MRKNTWSKNIKISAVLKADIECPECGGIHTIQQDLQPDDPDYPSMIMENPWFILPCPYCDAGLSYHFDIDIKAWARIHEERFQREPEPKKLEPQQLDLF